MIAKRLANERGHANHGWLDTYHSFSFAGYYHPDHMGFHTLRVINDDTVAPGAGFGTHGHDNMEIVSYVLEGALEHRDSMGTGSVLKPGDVQRMSAGEGVTHSEFNHSQTEPLRFLQIWILPARKDVAPSYEEKHFSFESRRDQLRLIVSQDGADGSLRIHQNARIYAALLSGGKTIEHSPTSNHPMWIQMASGTIRVNGIALSRGDGAAITAERLLAINGLEDSEFLLFELATKETMQ